MTKTQCDRLAPISTCGTTLLPDGTCPRCEPVLLRPEKEQQKVVADLEVLADGEAISAAVQEAKRIDDLRDPTIPFGSADRFKQCGGGAD